STFTVDLVGPSANVTAPSNYSVIATLSKLVGTASDAIAGIAAAGQVEVAIAEITPLGGCWNGTIAGGTFTAAACLSPGVPNFYPVTGADRAGTYSVPSTFW